MAVGRINGVAALTEFSYEKMYGRFAGQKNTGRRGGPSIFQKKGGEGGNCSLPDHQNMR